jgi:hypothetical protein
LFMHYGLSAIDSRYYLKLRKPFVLILSEV